MSKRWVFPQHDRPCNEGGYPESQLIRLIQALHSTGLASGWRFEEGFFGVSVPEDVNETVARIVDRGLSQEELSNDDAEIFARHCRSLSDITMLVFTDQHGIPDEILAEVALSNNWSIDTSSEEVVAALRREFPSLRRARPGE